jgi:hypothetical protein
VTVEREVQDRLHAEICGGDPTAWSRAFTTLLDPLIDALGFKWPDLRGTERLRDFAVDSIMTYVQEPARYDPSKSALLTYLRMDAHGDLLNEHAGWNVRGRPRPGRLSKSPTNSGRGQLTSIHPTVSRP